MSKKEEVVRDYKFTDAALLQLTDTVISTGTRDTAELTPQGVTIARLDALKLLNEAFRDLEDDEEWEGLVSEETEDKNEALEVCETKTRNIRRMAANIFGENSTTYKRFGFEGINDLKDVERIKAYFRIHRRASDKLVELGPEGLTAAFLTQYENDCKAADDAYDDMVDTIKDRDIATEERAKAGNVIYAEVVKICNTGKDYWFDKSEAKYNDYVINPNGTTAAQSKSGTITSGVAVNITLSFSNGSDKIGAVVEGIAGLLIYFATNPTDGPNGFQQTINPGGIETEFEALTLGYDPSRTYLMLYNPNATSANYTVRKKN